MYTDNKRGVVLISVLLIVLILSGISVSLGEIFFKSIKRSTYIEFQSTSIQLQRNMESLGIDLIDQNLRYNKGCLLYTSPSPRDISGSRMPSSA